MNRLIGLKNSRVFSERASPHDRSSVKTLDHYANQLPTTIGSTHLSVMKSYRSQKGHGGFLNYRRWRSRALVLGIHFLVNGVASRA